MPTYELSVKMVDSKNRETQKRYVSQDLTDFAAAKVEAVDIVDALANLSELRVLSYSLAENTVYTDTFDAGANKDEGVTFSVRKADNKRDYLKVPGPIPGIFDANGNVDPTNSAVVDYLGNFFASGGWTFSDGEVITEIIGGTLDT